MRARDAVFVGAFVFTLTAVAVAPVPAATTAAPAAASTTSSPSAGGWTHKSATASPQTVDVATLPKVKGTGKQSASRLPLLVRDPAAYAAAKKNPNATPGLAITKLPTARTAGPKTSIWNLNVTGLTSQNNIDVLPATVSPEPPDTQIAVGATRILEMVNSIGQVYTKAGYPPLALNPFTLDSFFLISSYWSPNFFGGEPLVPSDPRVLYDLSTGRWYATVLAFNPNTYDSAVLFGISNTNDPGAAWTIYILDGESHLLCDQPKLGFSSDKIIIGCSLFSGPTPPAPQGALLIVGSKSQAMNRSNITVTRFGPNTSAFGLVPAENMNSGISTAYIAFSNFGSATSVVRITGNPTLGFAGLSITQTDLAMTAMSSPPPAPQPTSTTYIDTGDDRFMSAFVQGGVLYTSGGISCTPAGDSAPRSCLRLVEVNLSLMRLNQAAAAGLVGKYLINPTLGVNSSGDVVLEYSVSSSSDFVGIETAIQPAGDPNTFVDGGQVVAGMGPYVGSATAPARWGDYGAVAMDPAAPDSVYVAGEWSNGSGGTSPIWATQIAELSARIPAVCSATDLTTDQMSPSPPGTTILVSGFASCVTPARPDYQFWIKPPGGVMAMVQGYHPSSPLSTFTWSGQVTLGTWTLEVRTRGTTETSKAYDSLIDLPYVITATPCTTPTLTPSAPSPQFAHTAVLLTAGTSCGAPPALYQFWVKTPDHVWHMVQPYGPSNTYNWAAFNTQLGSYLLEVLVKNTGSLGAYDSFTNIPYSLVLCTAPTLSTGAAASPYISGSGAITLTATGSCAGGTQFEFFYQDAANAWHLINGYGPSNTAPWNADYKAGSYHFQVALRPVGSTAGYVTYNVIPFTLTGCGVPTLSPDMTGPQLAGTTVNWTAGVTCTGTPQYSFFVKSPAGVWSMGQNWGPSATFQWLSPMTTGAYTVDVQVRNQGANEDVYDNYLTAAYSLTACTAPTLSTGAAASPYISGSGAITLTATGSCTGGTQFEFFYQDTSNAWHVIGGGYGSSNTAPWAADFKAGVYHFQVALRPVGSKAAFVTYAVIPFTLTGCGVPTLVPTESSPQLAGTTVHWTATVTCTGTPQYSFYVKSPAGVWSIGQNWGQSNTFAWTSPAAKGAYTVDVEVRNNNANEDVYDNYTLTSFTLN